jgi:hypothetical protein
MFKSVVSTITAVCFALASQTALALPSYYGNEQPDAVSDSDGGTRVLESGAYTDEEGHRISYELWEEDGVIYSDARVEVNRENHVELWREGDVIYFEGVIEGEPVAGELPSDFDADPDQELCLGWVALICLGAAFIAVLAATGSGCAHESQTSGGCTPPPTPSNPPGGQGGNPGDGDSDGDDDPGDGDGK